MEDTHPLLLVYGDTKEYQFPLILIIGREPNTDTVCDGNMWFYDFDEHSKCAFWNIAFSVVGRAMGLSRREVKEQFRRYNASPIIFSDAFGQGIKNEVSNKQNIRIRQIDNARAQVDAILTHTSVINRVGLVLLSGLDSKIYEPFKDLIKQKLSESDIRAIEIPFLYPTNMSTILSTLSQDDKALIAHIYSDYLKAVDSINCNQ